jgi:hypothetical protein
MRKNVIILFLALCLSACSVAQAQTEQILNFNELMHLLNSGEKVRVVIHYAQCKLFTDQKEQPSSPDAVSAMSISTFEYFAAGVANNQMAFVVFSDSRLIKNPIGKGYVYNYGKVRINSDNTVKIIAQYLNPKNYKVLMDEVFEAKVNNGKDNGGVYLYK